MDFQSHQNLTLFLTGVTSNTDAAQLAETFAESKCATKVGSAMLKINRILKIHCSFDTYANKWFGLQVVGVPVTLNGDLKNQFVETNVGFDTICKVR